MNHLLSWQSQVEMEDKPIGRLSRATALLPTHPPPTQHHLPSFPGAGQSLDTECRVVPNEGRMQDVGRAHFQAIANMGGSGSHLRPPPAASTMTPVVDPEEHLNSSVFLHPKTKKRTWPLLPVACGRWSKEEYDSSFKKVVKYLKDAVDYHKTLRDSARNIHYKLMMIGSSLESAKPSILVMCNYTDWGSLNSLLKKIPSQEYNCMIPSTWDRAYKFRFRDGGLSRMSNLKPILWLYLCPTSFETLKRLNGVPVSIECSALVTMCGSLVEFEGRQSTISLTLDIDGEDRLLTVEHIFQDNELENDEPQMSLDPESLASIESNIEQWDFLNDSEDDTSMDLDTDWNSNDDDTQMDGELPATSVNCDPSQVSHEPMRPRVEAPARLSRSHKQGERVEPPNGLPHQSPYLDWACLRLVDYQLAPRRQSNVLLRRGKPPGLLEDVATKPRTHAVPVFMISGILGVRSGRLIALPSYLGSSKGQDLCETWTIILDQQEAFHPGESGSIVVDQKTLEIYGHLVGSDMFGYGHVVPLSRIIEQIKTAFNVDNAGLPTLENSNSHQEGDMDNKFDKELTLLLREEWPDKARVQQLIKRGADVNRPDTYGETPLGQAASSGRQAIVELLLENGTDVNRPDEDGEMPLWRAVEARHQGIIELLLQNGADVNSPNKNGETPLWRAVEARHQGIIELLLQNGADVNSLNKNGETPLWRAVESNYQATVELLLQNGADLSVINENGQTLLFKAISEKDLSIIKLLLQKGADLSMPNKHGETPLFKAASTGVLSIIKLLLENGADLNRPNKNGQTPLWGAAEYRHLSVVKLLLSQGSEANYKDEHNRTPLWRATQNGYGDIVEALVEAGADINTCNEDGQMLVQRAAAEGQHGIVDLLCKAGAEVNTTDDAVRAALLSTAVEKGYSYTLQQLIKAGAEVNFRDKDGDMPLLIAARYGHSDITQQLIKAGAEVNFRDKGGDMPLLIAARYGHSDITQQLIKESAEVNVKNKDGCTPLLYAAQHGYSDITQQLIKESAEVNVKNKDGCTPLLYAAQHGYSDITQQLIKESAEVNVKNKDGRTPLLYAAEKGYSDITQQLIKASALLDSKDNQGQTALFLAVQRRNYDIIRMLIEGGAATDAEDNRGRTLLTLAKKLKVDLFMYLPKAKDSVDEEEG